MANNTIWYPGELASLLLDSRLITRVRLKKYSFKIIKCGDYLQLYYYKVPKEIQYVEKLDIDNLKKKSRGAPIQDKKIEDRNIIRTKLNCQRLAKANAKEWTSFLTLTYADNMQDVKQAKIDLNFFVKNIKKVKKDFKYIAIPEFQKRGAIHFHLLTNLTLQDNNIIIKQRTNEKYYDIKYWNKGFTSFESVAGDIKKIVGYISKYMTKECDDRLFSFRRFSSSQNLIKPVTEFISMRDKTSRDWFTNIIKNKECIYTNDYKDPFDNEVSFMEFLSVNIIEDETK